MLTVSPTTTVAILAMFGPETAEFGLVEGRPIDVETEFGLTVSKGAFLTKTAESTSKVAAQLRFLLFVELRVGKSGKWHSISIVHVHSQ